MARLSIPAADGIPFAPVDAAERTFVGLAWEANQERRLEKALKGLAILKTICVNGKVFELSYIKTLLQNTADNGSFQNLKFNYVERAKITICNNAIISTDKSYWQTPGMWWKKHQRKMRMSGKLVTMATTSKMMTTVSILTMTTRMK